MSDAIKEIWYYKDEECEFVLIQNIFACMLASPLDLFWCVTQAITIMLEQPKAEKSTKWRFFLMFLRNYYTLFILTTLICMIWQFLDIFFSILNPIK